MKKAYKEVLNMEKFNIGDKIISGKFKGIIKDIRRSRRKHKKDRSNNKRS